MPAILLYAVQAIQIAAALAAAGKDVATLLGQIRDAMAAMQTENRYPSAQEWQALNAQTIALLNELNAPKAT